MKELKITTGVAAALLAAGCGQSRDADNGWTASQDVAVCVDKDGKRVPDGQCPRQQFASGHPYPAGSPFLWYYIGRSQALPYYGDVVRGGGYRPAAGRSYFRAPSVTSMTRSTAIARGGFGSSARGLSGRGGS